MASTFGGRLKGLVHTIRNKQCDAAFAEVQVCRFQSTAQIDRRCHVTDGVVNKHRIERAPQPQRAHIRLDMFALRIQSATMRQHPRGGIAEGHLKMALEMERVVTAARAEFQNVTMAAQQRAIKTSLFLVVFRRGKQRPPFRQRRVQKRKGTGIAVRQ